MSNCIIVLDKIDQRHIMLEKIREGEKKSIVWVCIVGLLLIIPGGCSKPKPFTIGMVNDVSVREPILDGFKAGMSELGYDEGKNVKYIYNGATGIKDEVIDAEIRKMLSQKADIILVLGNAVAFRAKKILEGTDIAVVVVAMGSPIESGLIESVGHPGGNLTGVQMIRSDLKGLEWLAMISPGIKKVYLPYDAADVYAADIMEDVKEGASQLGVEVLLQPVHTAEEAAAAIENLPGDIGAVYRMAAPVLDNENYKLSQAAIKRGLPMASVIPLDEGVLLTRATSVFEMGRQSARFADQIRRGAKPADLPVETAEVFLTVNLKTAEKLGLDIPDIILMNAKTIIR